jgi:hypothetical protein
MGGAQLSSTDMQTYTNFVNTIQYLPNPYQNLDRSLPASLFGGNAANGAVDFSTLPLTVTVGKLQTCNSCHTAVPSGPGSSRQINAPTTGTPQPLKNPQLRNVYQKMLRGPYAGPVGLQVIDGFGLNHDGNADLKAFFSAAIFKLYSPQQVLDMSAYLLSFDTGTAPAVGYTRTMSSANVANSAVQNDWNLLQSQAGAGNIDLIAQGTINGTLHWLMYFPGLSTYVSDTSTSYTQAQLQSLIQNGDVLSFMGVYPGTGSAALK